ncbi:MAG: hypothetical protein Kow0056_05400 [Coriobacteriia bacterium]
MPRPHTKTREGAPSKAGRLVWAGVAVVLVMAAVLVFLYGRGGGPLPGWLGFLGPRTAGLLDPSGPEEAVLRTLRLAGYDHAVVGESDGTVVVRVEVPRVRTPADVELTWQTALGVSAEAFPEAERYVAQVFSDGTALVEVGIGGSDLRGILDSGDAGSAASALEEQADVILLSRSGGGGG